MPEYGWRLQRHFNRVERVEIVRRTPKLVYTLREGAARQERDFREDVYATEADAYTALIERLRDALRPAQVRVEWLTDEIEKLNAKLRSLSGDPVYTRRSDGRLEQMCEHGIGHTVAIDRVKYLQPYEGSSEKKRQAWWSHGCDGCCAGMERLHA